MQREQKATELALKFLGDALKLFDNELQGQARLAIDQRRSKFERNKRIRAKRWGLVPGSAGVAQPLNRGFLHRSSLSGT